MLNSLDERWMFKPTYIIIHHSLTEDGELLSTPAIRNYHVLQRHWRDIGYHYILEKYYAGYEVIMGRPLNMEGAHCASNSMNWESIGICFVGNFDKHPPPKMQWNKGLTLVKSLMDIYDIPSKNVVGHRKYSQKSCPGQMFDMALFRAECDLL